MERKVTIPEFSQMTSSFLIPWPWPDGDPASSIYHFLDKAQQAKMLPVLIKHCVKVLGVQQKAIQEIIEIEMGTLKEMQGR